MSYTVTVRERNDGQLWITIPAAIRRQFGLRTGNSVRLRKLPGMAFGVSFFRRGRLIRIRRFSNRSEVAFEEVEQRSIGVEGDIMAKEGGCVSATEFAARLKLRSRRSVDRYRAAKKIFALPKGPRLVYPVWQIESGALLPGLNNVLRMLIERKTAPFSMALFFLTPAEALDKKRPLDLLREGRIAEVKLHVQRYGDIGA